MPYMDKEDRGNCSYPAASLEYFDQGRWKLDFAHERVMSSASSFQICRSPISSTSILLEVLQASVLSYLFLYNLPIYFLSKQPATASNKLLVSILATG